MKSPFERKNNRKSRSKGTFGIMRAGQMIPVAGHPVRPGESGMMSINFATELFPIQGRMLTPIFSKLTVAFVPVQAADGIADGSAYAGMTEIVRQKLLAGPILPTVPENPISITMDIQPKMIGGVTHVSSIAHRSYNALINYLRRRRYHAASQVAAENTLLTPSVIEETTLERFNAALDPSEQVNGAVQLSIPDMNLPVEGFGSISTANPLVAAGTTVRENGQTDTATTGEWQQITNAGFAVRIDGQTPSTAQPRVTARLNGIAAGNVSLVDFYNAQTRDRMTREFAEIIKENPEHGQEMIIRWAQGLSVVIDDQPIILAEEVRQLNPMFVQATDGAGIMADTTRTDHMGRMSITVPVPRTELGGMIIVIAEIKPDEVVSNQPDPELTRAWALDNYAADEMVLDPQPIKMRDLSSSVVQGSEATIAMWAGLNELFKNYSTYGIRRNLTQANFAGQQVLWTYNVPISVTPDNILYPASLDHSVFVDTVGPAAAYTVNTTLALSTPIIYGPSPVETLSAVEAANLFEE